MLELLRRHAEAFDQFSEEWYYQMDHALEDTLRRERGERVLEQLFGGPNGAGRLGEDLDRITGRAVTRFREATPRVSPMEEALFCYMAIGMDNDLIRRRLKLNSKTTASVRKNRLAAKIGKLEEPHREEFLELIGRMKKP